MAPDNGVNERGAGWVFGETGNQHVVLILRSACIGRRERHVTSQLQPLLLLHFRFASQCHRTQIPVGSPRFTMTSQSLSPIDLSHRSALIYNKLTRTCGAWIAMQRRFEDRSVENQTWRLRSGVARKGHRIRFAGARMLGTQFDDLATVIFPAYGHVSFACI